MTDASPRALSVVVPAYNEAGCIDSTLRELLARLGADASRALEILVCDDGSRDATPRLVEGVGDSRVRLLRSDDNRGKGAAVRRGMLAASAATILMTDADMSTPVSEYPALAARLGPVTPVVIGSRYLSREGVVQPWGRHLSGRAFSWLARTALGLDCRDTQCGFKLFTAGAARFLFERARVDGFAFDAEILYIARLHGIGVAEVAVRWVQDRASRVRVARESWPMMRDLIRIRVGRRTYLRPDSGELSGTL